MSASGWGAPDWRAGDGERERLPDIEDLPIAEQGYDREAVREAFDRFYRHAAQLDSTLRVLESVEAFSGQARELRADIRSLRAASWGPAPSARHVWSVGHEAWAPEEPPAALAASLPRLALWAALIVAVGVGAALADLRTLVIVALVLGAWLLVGVIELVIASSRAARVHAPLAPPGAAPVAEPAPAASPAEAPAVASPQETMISTPASSSVGEGASPAPVAEAPAAVAEQEAVVSEDDGSEPADSEPVPVAAEEGPPRRGLFRRRREPERVDDTDPQLAAPDLAPAGWRPQDSHVDPWEGNAEENGEPDELDEPLEAAAPPARGLLRRGRR